LHAGSDYASAFFLAKFDAKGATSYSLGFPSAGNIGFPDRVSLAAAPKREVVATGSFSGSIDLGSGPLSSGGGFVARFDAKGHSLWSIALAGYPVAACDAQGNVFVAGQFVGASGLDAVYLSKLDHDGQLLWRREIDGVAPPEGGSWLAVNGSGRVGIALVLYGTTDFGTGPLVPSSPGETIALARFDAEGHGELATTIDLAANAWTVSLGADGRLAAFGSAAAPGEALYQSRLTGLGADGALVLERSFRDDDRHFVAFGPHDDLLLVGPFTGTLDIAGVSRLGRGGPAMFVADTPWAD
jgi:hypothetical protein